MYQLSLDGLEDRGYKEYGESSAVYFIRPNLQTVLEGVKWVN